MLIINPTSLDLYSVIVENKKMEQGLHSQSDKSVAVAPYTITIQVILKGVNGSQGKPYFQDKGTEMVSCMTSMMSDEKLLNTLTKLTFSH